ncbi:hypothetical protein [Streptomyces kebangsaanensis]|uniref:hypothetical protein n=1 Tax=Streptomyces kebangsaanensis TaxID=864058 RepID=UPI00093FFA9C|nr:hypothetical protein [Streptomyces kebangsaanensis]
MGDRHSDGGSRVPAPGGSAPNTEGLRSALGRALRAEVLDAPAEQRALAAFRAARDSGIHRQADTGKRTRRRDDWRPRRRPGRRSVKAAVAVFVSGLTLSGVAVAAIGTPGKGDHRQDGDDGGAPRRPSTSAPAAPPAPAPSASSAPTPYDTASPGGPSATLSATLPAVPSAVPAPGRPPTAKDIQAHCRAYPSVKGSGKALESAAWQRFLAAAGGEGNVAAYCAEQLSQAQPGDPGKAKGRSQGNTTRPTAEQAHPSQAAGKGKGSSARQE